MAVSTPLTDFQDFQHQVLCTDLQALAVQQYLKEFPTPPLSPDHEDKDIATNPLPELPMLDSSPLTVEIDQVFNRIVHEFGQDNDVFNCPSTSDYPQLLDVVDPGMLPSVDSGKKAIVNDCWWNSRTYEPRHSVGGNMSSNTGTYTPAPSPPPEMKEPIDEEEEEDDEDDESCSDLSSEPGQQGDLSPSEMFARGAAAILANQKCCLPQHKQQQEQQQQQEHQARLLRKAEREERRTSTGSRKCGSSRVQPRVVDSESGI